MQLEIQANNKTKYQYIRNGVAGNRQTVFQMSNLVRQAVDYDKGLNDMANKLLISNGYTAYNEALDPLPILELVYSFIRSHIAYLSDKAGKIESIKSARQTLTDGYGDCDDLAILAASMLGVLGFENINFVMASYDNNSNGFEHIYIEVMTANPQTKKDSRYVLDLSLPDNLAKVNYEIPYKKAEKVSIFKQDTGTKVFGALFNLKSQGKELFKQSVNTIPYVVQFMPLGFLSGNMLIHGANLITESDISNLSLNELGSKIHNELDTLANLIINNQVANEYAKSYAMQIASQLSAYTPNIDEKENYRTVSNSIKNKVKYIYYLADNTDCVELNPKGMFLGGVLVCGIIGYTLYKQRKF